MKKILSRVWSFIKEKVLQIEDKVERLTPVAVKIVEAVKKTVENDTFISVMDIATAAIPGEKDDAFVAAVLSIIREYIPKIALQLRIINEINQFDNLDEKVFAVIEVLKHTNDEQKSDYWHELAAFILRKLADGKITLGEAAAIAEYHYQNYIKIK